MSLYLPQCCSCPLYDTGKSHIPSGKINPSLNYSLHKRFSVFQQGYNFNVSQHSDSLSSQKDLFLDLIQGDC